MIRSSRRLGRCVIVSFMWNGFTGLIGHISSHTEGNERVASVGVVVTSWMNAFRLPLRNPSMWR